MDEDLLEFENYITDLYDFNLLDLLEEEDEVLNSNITHFINE